MELDIRSLRRDGWATRAAVDLGGSYGDDEVSVETRITAGRGGVALVMIEHDTILVAHTTRRKRKSATTRPRPIPADASALGPAGRSSP
jgi:hypothetical protein